MLLISQAALLITQDTLLTARATPETNRAQKTTARQTKTIGRQLALPHRQTPTYRPATELAKPIKACSTPNMNEGSPPNKLRVAALQLPLVWGDKAAAFDLLEAQLAALSDVRLVLLPEAFITGYLSPEGRFDLRPYAETIDGESRQRFAALAKQFNVALAVPLIEQAGQQYFNSMLFLDEHGALLGHYRKRHPWFPEKWASPGDLGFPVFLWGGCRLCMAICFDLHFLGKERGRELKQADLLLISSVWVEEEGDTRTPQLQNLAKKFQVNILNTNWAQSIPRLPSQGGSIILDAQGNTLARAADAAPQAVIADLDLGLWG